MRKHLPLVIIVLLVAAAFSGEGGDRAIGTSKHVVIVHETADDTPAQARAFVALRDGPEAQHFADKEVLLSIIDDDAIDEQNALQVSPEDYVGKELPVILFYSKRGKLNYVQSLGSDVAAETIVEICKRHGA